MGPCYFCDANSCLLAQGPAIKFPSSCAELVCMLNSSHMPMYFIPARS
jgi:hypothetical protein